MRRTLTRVLSVVAVTAVILVAGVMTLARPDAADEFYRVLPPPDAPPGTLLQSEAMTRAVPDGAEGWRMLYTSTRPDGSPVVASAVVVIPSDGRPHPVIAYAHGTSGVANGCAPSLFEDPFPNVPGFPALLSEGWAFIGPDYAGLGTEGRHFYLVGPDAGRALLDALRAARELAGSRLASQAILWGHSQGGHAALWAGQIAPDYASELTVGGIGVLAPATNLPDLMVAASANPFGKVVSAYLAEGYAAAYPADDIDGAVRPLARPGAGLIADYCVDGGISTLVPALLSFTIPRSGVFRERPGNLVARLAENMPTGPFPAPVLVGQGGADDLVSPAIQREWSRQRCAEGVEIDFRVYDAADHVSVTAPDAPAVAALMSWTRDLFRGRPIAEPCRFD